MTEQADFPPPAQPTPGLREPAPSSGKGCFFWGCLICVILGVLFVGCVGFCGYMVYSRVMSFTSTEPIDVPVYEPQPGQVEEIQARVESFSDDGNAAPGTLEITADDLNALVSSAPEVAGKVFFRIEDDVLRAQVSIPLDPIPFLSGRYFNGELGVRPRLVNGQPAFDVESARVGETELPPEQITPAVNQVVTNIMNDSSQELAELRQFLQQLNSLEVRDGKLIMEH